MPSAEVALHEFVSEQKRLLDSELRAEEDSGDVGKNNEAHPKDDGSRDGGYFLRNINVVDTSVGLYGRTVVTFGNSSQQATSEADNDIMPKKCSRSSTLLQAHRLTVGDEVQVLPNNGRGYTSTKKSKYDGGVICAVDDVSVSVALFSGNTNSRQQSSISSGKDSTKKQGKKSNKEEDPDGDGEMLGGNPPYALIPRSSVEVHNKMISALDELDKFGVSHPIAGDIVMAAFEPNNSKHNTDMTRERIEALDSECNLASTKLDFSQREAVVTPILQSI